MKGSVETMMVSRMWVGRAVRVGGSDMIKNLVSNRILVPER